MMRLIGMLDSPYVRRVAISMKFMGLPFAHQSLSVHRNFPDFAAVNPVVKAPTVVTDDGTVLMDSTLILEHLERLVPPERRLAVSDIEASARATRILGLALTACEKSVQLIYERTLRPLDKQHQAWIDRVSRQLAAAYRLLEAEIGAARPWLFADRPLQPDITAAVAWRFTRSVFPDAVPADVHPRLSAFSQAAEALPEFVSTPLE